jgi:flagellar hook-length control protein FliK
VQNISVTTGIGNANGNPAVVSTSQAAPNSVTASASGSAGNQPGVQSDGLVLNQVFRVDGSQASRDRQSSSDSGETLSDLLKQGAVQAYAANSDGSKVDTSFKQAMSAATNYSPASAMKTDPVQVAQSIVKQVNLMTQEGKTVVNMKLQPEDLGTVVLKVASQDGKISAEFNVKTPEARAFLETSIPQMRQALETNGVSLAHLSVSLSAGDSNGGRPQYQAKKQQPKYYAAITADQVEAARTFGYNTMELKV